MSSNSTVPAEWIPRLNMEFRSEEEAWLFWTFYGNRLGFNVRKSYCGKSSRDGKITSKHFVYSNEGFLHKDKLKITQRAKPETRTGCSVHMTIKFIRSSQRYKVIDFISAHNHALRWASPVNEVVTSDPESLKPVNLELGRGDQEIYLTCRSQEALSYGEAVSLLNYFVQQGLTNPDFMHVERLDAENRITGVFWADAKMLNDYVYFGDVVTLDTTYCRDKGFRPLGAFVGLNHFRDTVVFGAALLYNTSVESFEWLFSTFLESHKGKKPKTILTNQDSAIALAITNVMPETLHGFSSWQMMENAAKHPSTELVDTLRACLYDYEKEAEFEATFTDMKCKIGADTWLTFLHDERKKWAYWGCKERNRVKI